MSATSAPIQKQSYRITFGKFIPAFFSSLKRLMSALYAMKKFKALDKNTCLSLGKCVEEASASFGSHPAILFEDRMYTYRELNNQSNRFANYFLSLGVKRGEVIAVLLENRPELLFAIIGLAKIGAVASLINPNLRGSTLEYCVTLNPTRHVIIGESLMPAFQEIKSALNMNPETAFYILQDTDKQDAPDGYIGLDAELLKAQSTNPSTTNEIKLTDPYCFIFTSGTTGKPKAAVIDNRRWVGSYEVFGTMMDLNPKDTLYIPLPFNHGTAHVVGWACAVKGGAATVMRRVFSASKFWEDVQKFNVTAFVYIGELCRYLINQPARPNDADNSIKKMVGNGLRPDIWVPFKKRFAIDKIFEFYASTEGNISFSNIMNLDCTIGISGMDFDLIKYDIESEEPVKGSNGFFMKADKGEPGLLISEISDASPFIGYTGNQETEDKILRNVFKENDAWFNTGDLIKNIGFGHYQFADRVGDTFRWKSENVSTTEVEEIISAQDQVKESTVYGVEIPGTVGRAGMASLIPKGGAEQFDLKNFLESIRKDLPPYAIPIFLRFQKEFEITATMKHIKTALKRGGYNPTEISDPLYVMLPGESQYSPLTKEIYLNILNEAYRF